MVVVETGEGAALEGSWFASTLGMEEENSIRRAVSRLFRLEEMSWYSYTCST